MDIFCRSPFQDVFFQRKIDFEYYMQNFKVFFIFVHGFIPDYGPDVYIYLIMKMYETQRRTRCSFFFNGNNQKEHISEYSTIIIKITNLKYLFNISG